MKPLALFPIALAVALCASTAARAGGCVDITTSVDQNGRIHVAKEGDEARRGVDAKAKQGIDTLSRSARRAETQEKAIAEAYPPRRTGGDTAGATAATRAGRSPEACAG